MRDSSLHYCMEVSRLVHHKPTWMVTLLALTILPVVIICHSSPNLYRYGNVMSDCAWAEQRHRTHVMGRAETSYTCHGPSRDIVHMSWAEQRAQKWIRRNCQGPMIMLRKTGTAAESGLEWDAPARNGMGCTEWNRVHGMTWGAQDGMGCTGCMEWCVWMYGMVHRVMQGYMGRHGCTCT